MEGGANTYTCAGYGATVGQRFEVAPAGRTARVQLRDGTVGARYGTVGPCGGVPYGTVGGGSTYVMATGPGYGVANTPGGAICNGLCRNLTAVIPVVRGAGGGKAGGSRAAIIPAGSGVGAPVDLASIIAASVVAATAGINAAHATSLTPPSVTR